jgi:hypothetical protein
VYEDGEEQIKHIVHLLDACPEPLRPKAFEILLQGYVDSIVVPSLPQGATSTLAALQPAPPAGAANMHGDAMASVPAEVLPRLRAMAKRRSVSEEKLAGLFDFSLDPFSFAPLHVTGANKGERTRRVALMVAGRSFLATGKWTADWAEIKAMCTHQNCYDQANFASTLKASKGSIFKSVEVQGSVELSSAGTDEAEKLMASLAIGENGSVE